MSLNVLQPTLSNAETGDSSRSSHVQGACSSQFSESGVKKLLVQAIVKDVANTYIALGIPVTLKAHAVFHDIVPFL